MNIELKTSAITNSPTKPLRPAGSPLEFGAGFRQFLMSSPVEDAMPSMTSTFRQPTQYLESVPPVTRQQISAPAVSPSEVQESLSRSLGAAILLAARPTTRSLRLAQAVSSLRAS